MKILSRQLTLDLYNCSEKKMTQVDEIKKLLQEAIGEEPRLIDQKIDAEHCAIIGVFLEGHIALHIYGDLRYVAADIFTCAENTEPDEISKVLRKFFQPEKVKSTFLKRGDLGKSDLKPKIKTRVAPLRKVKNAVVKTLVRRGDL